MRRIVLALLVGVLCFNLGAGLGVRPVRADGMVLPEVLSPDYLVVRTHHVTVAIEDGHAVTRVDQEFANPHSFPVSGRYLFPVPPDAILSGFSATVDGQRQPVVHQDPAATNSILYDVVAQRRDPSLLQYADWETLAFDLSLPAGGSRRMALEYEEVLSPAGGLYRYRYVLSTERYSSQPLEQVSLTIDVHSTAGLSTVYSSPFPAVIEQQSSDRARVTWQAENVRPTEDFELFFAPAEGGFGGGLLTGRRAGADHFVFLFAPEAETADRDIVPKDIVFVVDRSGSMGGEKIEQAQDALRLILGQLNDVDRFSIVGFDHRLSVLSSTLLPVEKDAVVDARRFVGSLDADGNTDLEAALQAGLKILLRSDERDASQMVVFLTDGLPTEGVTDETLIAELVTGTNSEVGARLHVFGVGYDVNTHLLDHLAADNGGTVTFIQPGENLEAVLTGFYARIAAPVLTDVEIEFEGLEVGDLYPQALPDLFQGSSLLLAGRYQATSPAVTVRVSGRSGRVEREYVYNFDVGEDASPSHDFVPRLWATRRVGDLLDRVRVEGERSSLVDEIRELGLAYGLVTPYTTFVIEAQVEGAASAANMALYGDQAQLNQAWGQTTVQARVQNQQYQQAAQANLASGANVVNSGQHSLAQIGRQNVDLALLQGVPVSDLSWQVNPGETVTLDWVERTIGVDRNVVFGSEEYFQLAKDPDARTFMQSGPNVVFAYQGQVISVQEALEENALEALEENALEALEENALKASDEDAAEPTGATQATVRPVSDWVSAWLQEFINGLRRVVEVWLGA